MREDEFRERFELIERILESLEEDEISITRVVNMLFELGVIEEPYICSDSFYDIDCLRFALRVLKWIKGCETACGTR